MPGPTRRSTSASSPASTRHFDPVPATATTHASSASAFSWHAPPQAFCWIRPPLTAPQIELSGQLPLFEELARQGIGLGQPLLYRAWALMLEQRGAPDEAQAVLEKGLARGVDPPKLRAALDELRGRRRPRAAAPAPAFPVFVDSLLTPSRAPAPAAPAAQAAGGEGSDARQRAPEKAGYSRALVTGSAGQEISFEELRAARRPPPPPPAAKQPLQPAVAMGRPILMQSALEDSEESEPEADLNATSAGLQTGMMTVNSLMAMHAVADWWKSPIDLEKKPGLAAPAPAPAPLRQPVAAALQARPAAPAMQIYVDPQLAAAPAAAAQAATQAAKPAPLQPAASAPAVRLEEPAAWVEQQAARSEVQDEVAPVSHFFAAAAPALAPGSVLETERSLIELKEQVSACVWKAEEVDKDETAEAALGGGAVVRASGPGSSVERLIWYAAVARQLARQPQPPRHLLQPRALLHFADRSLLVLPLADQPTLAEVLAFYRGRQRAVDETLALYYAAEMLARLEELHRCGLVHGATERAGHWQLVFENAERFEAWKPGGWEHKGLRLLDWSHALPLGARLAPPAGHPLARLLPAAWDVHLDALGLACVLHELLHGAPLQLAPGGPRYRPQPAARRLECGLWSELFDALLNVAERPPALGALRAGIEAYLSSQPQKARQLKSLILKQKVELHEAAEQAAGGMEL